MLHTPCSPEATGLPIETLDKWRCTTMPRKIDKWTGDFCSACPNRVAAFCESQGWWTNLDGNLVFLDGIFGGYTQSEREARGPRKSDLSEV